MTAEISAKEGHCMTGILWILLLPAGISVLLYLLYIFGFLVVNNKRAVTYVGSMRGNQAVFSSCTGCIRRVVRFREEKTYAVTLETELTAGEMSVELLDSGRRQLLCLNSGSRSAAIPVEKGRCYTLVFRFASATGKYILHWD